MQQSIDRETLIAFFERGIPFNAHLGMKVEALTDHTATLRVPFQPSWVGDPFRPALHGGLISTVADAAGGLAVYAAIANPTARAATVDIRVDYLRPGRLEDLWCDATLIRRGNRVAVTTMVVRQAGDHVVAECRGVYNVVRVTSA